MKHNIYVYIFIMFAVTYLIRVLPLTLIRKPIKNRFLRSFLHYVPPACLTAMTFPAILYATEHPVSGLAGLLAGIFLALKKASLIVVAAASCGTVLLLEFLLKFLA